MFLIVNTGSSSIKLAVFDDTGMDEATVSASAERLGRGETTLEIRPRNRDEVSRTRVDSLAGAIGAFLDWLEEEGQLEQLEAIGHRVVHGGTSYSSPVVVDDRVRNDLEHLISIDPEHLPRALACIKAVGQRLPQTPQVACFDTAFHQAMPSETMHLSVPRGLFERGVRRYGFHGLSYEYIVQELGRIDPESDAKRTIIAHLGNGASMAAVREGKSIDTTMGMTPTGGLMMGTRSGDLDPGVVLAVMHMEDYDAEGMNQLLNKESGMIGISGVSGDMRDLLDAESTNERAALAVSMFCLSARKQIGAFTAVLGGLDRLVFSGGIGEHAAPVRSRICAGFEYLGLSIHKEANAENREVVSTGSSRVEVRIVRTDEDAMIARHTRDLIRRTSQ
jgi:acetate kinase